MLKYECTQIGYQWQITNNKGLSFSIPDLHGMLYLCELLTNPMQQIQYTNLISRGLYKKPNLEFNSKFKADFVKYGFHEQNWYNAIPMADKKTIHEVAKEILSVRDQITELKEFGDIARVELMETELSKLIEYFRSVFTKRNRIKMFRGDLEQLRDCIKKSLWRTYKYLRPNDRELVEFFSTHIHLYSSYIQMEPYSGYEFIFKKA